MATRTIFVDDITGKEDETVKTRYFSMDGIDYEIDASDTTWKTVANAMNKVIDKGRRAAKKSGKQPSGRQADASTRKQNRAIRVWAAENGITVSARGRIPQDVIDRAVAAGISD